MTSIKSDIKGLVKKLITSVLVSNPSKSLLTIPELDRDYQQQVGEPIPYSTVGYSSLEAFLVDIPDILKIEVIGGSNVVRPIVSSKVEHIHKLVSKQKKPANKNKELLKPTPRNPTGPNEIPFVIRSRLKNLIKSFKNGLVCSELPGVYKARYKKELNYHMFKYGSLLEMCQAMKSIFTCCRVATGEVVLYPVERYLPVVPKQTKEPNYSPRTSTPIPTDIVEEPSFLMQQMDLDLHDEIGYPFNVLKFDETIPCQFLEPSVHIRDLVRVCVTEIYDPSKFWMTLHKYSADFEELHNHMQLWYAQCTDYNIAEKFVQYGIFCAAPYGGEFYRAMVVKLLPEIPLLHLVKVFFIDYGTVSVVDSRHLRFLHKNFSRLPQQAIRARLGEIYPIIEYSQWTNEAFEQFLNFVTEKVLIAEILEINYESEIIDVKLRLNSYTLPINDALVFDKKAIYRCQHQRLGTHPNPVPSVRNIHLYPTFNEIEQAVVPTNLENNYLLKLGFSYDYLYPHYYKKEEEDEIYNNNARGVSINAIR